MCRSRSLKDNYSTTSGVHEENDQLPPEYHIPFGHSDYMIRLKRCLTVTMRLNDHGYGCREQRSLCRVMNMIHDGKIRQTKYDNHSRQSEETL